MRSRRQLLMDHEATREIWPAFTDVMSTMAMILFVLVLLAFVRNLISSKRLEAFERQIAASELKLRALGGELKEEKIDAIERQIEVHKTTKTSEWYEVVPEAEILAANLWIG